MEESSNVWFSVGIWTDRAIPWGRRSPGENSVLSFRQAPFASGPMGFGKGVQEHIYLQSLALGDMMVWRHPAGSWGLKPGSCLGWRRKSFKSTDVIMEMSGVAGVRAVQSGIEQVTQVCLDEHLRTPWHRKRGPLAEKEQLEGEEKGNQDTELLELVERV